jgi:hypothetical protein
MATQNVTTPPISGSRPGIIVDPSKFIPLLESVANLSPDPQEVSQTKRGESADQISLRDR